MIRIMIGRDESLRIQYLKEFKKEEYGK